jgi:hypothetical protein
MQTHRTAYSLVLTVVTILTLASASAREKWPQMTDADKQRVAGWKEHEQEVLTNIAPQLEEWAKKGKPFYANAIVPSDLPQARVPAFPGAEGAGKFSFGGRGGKVFVVTNLDDSGPGTLREAVESAGPRIVVFNVAGIIHLKMPLFVKAPYLTIAGQTAPGDGVCVAGESTLVDTHDVVIRYMRFRRGNDSVFDRDDALGGNPIGNIIVDHCSCSWGGDENLSMYRHITSVAVGGTDQKLPTLNITLQWNISSEALNTYNHAFGGTWGGRNSSFHHNLFANNTARNPSIGMTYDFNFVNNVLFNWRHRTVDGGDKGSLYNIINNYYRSGPAVNPGAVAYRILEPSATQKKPDLISYFGKAYVVGNVVEGNDAVTKDNWNGGVQFADGGSKDDPDTSSQDKAAALIEKVRVDKPFPMVPVTMTSAQEAYKSILENAGATLPHRDPVDLRIVKVVKTGKVWSPGEMITPTPMKGLTKNDVGTAGNGIITDISQIGGYPEYKGEPSKDIGADGIPLWWKNKFKLDANDVALAQKDLSGDGYTVIEKFLNGLDPTQKIDWKNAQNNVNTLTEDKLTK